MTEGTAALDFESGWSLEGLRDTTLFFRNVHLVLPSGSFLVLEEGSMANDVRQFVAAHPEVPKVAVPHGTWWPRSRMHWLAPTPEVLGGLAALSLRHAEPEICDHLYGVREGSLILRWHDAFDDPLFISSEIPFESVSAFGRAIGLPPEPWQAA